MNNYFGNARYIFKDADGSVVVEGMWYKHSHLVGNIHKPVKIISICDNSIKYQTPETLNSGVFKTISSPELIQKFLVELRCTGYVPNGEFISVDNYIHLDKKEIDLSLLTTDQLLEELKRRLK